MAAARLVTAAAVVVQGASINQERLNIYPGQLFPPDSSECEYTSCYCEENVWQLCRHDYFGNSSTYVVFISNTYKAVPLWMQKNDKDDSFVRWDYHVICIRECGQEAVAAEGKPLADYRVFDHDSRLDFGSDFKTYASQTFQPRPESQLPPEYEHRFRVVAADHFLRAFASDRRHMRRSDGGWQAEPPEYPAIKTEESEHNLDEFLDMAGEPLESMEPTELRRTVQEVARGAVMRLPQLRCLFGCA